MHDDPTASGRAARPLPGLAGPAAAQRWRLVLARDVGASSRTQRELSEDWETAILGSGLPVLRSEGATGRPRIAFGAPLPLGMAAERELLDVVITERWPVWQVRAALDPRIPSGWRLIDVYDVWLGAPALAGRVAAADYRVTLASDDAVPADRLADACRDLTRAGSIERERPKGTSTVRYDLRPLLASVRVLESGPPPVVAVRTRFHPELGTGRPEEVVAALGEAVGARLEITSIVRERLVLAEDLGSGG